ncbi:hypothetical protein EP164_11625 [Photorhabdus luminescens subsp. sonorensis]|uniref:Uncharacterized protein n=1 Tax=Photorhabdus luminescens subsp. sonorensis TaxID=1173677 RepID=A0A5C4RIT2_PHOLU|nr:hypothetical protein EP164_11625 [Photorhabdus luminescens subsp. sonorensis]
MLSKLNTSKVTCLREPE